MKCYFCQTELTTILHESCYHCLTCTQSNGLGSVSTCMDDDGDLLYAHIYIDETQTIIIPNSGRFPGSGVHIISGHMYHIRLHLKEDYTVISDDTEYSWNPLLKVPGFKINPSNAKEKLKLYLLFS